MSQMVGADPDVLDRLAQALGQHAKSCTAARHAAGQAVQTLQGQWNGPDQAAFARVWHATEKDLADVSTQLAKLSTVLRNNAAAQRKTSAADLPAPASAGGAGGSSRAPGSSPGSDSLLEQFWKNWGGFAPPGQHDPVSLALYAAGLLGTAGGYLASWMTTVNNGIFRPLGPDGRIMSPRALSFLERLRAGAGRFPTARGLSTWEKIKGFDKAGNWKAKGWRGLERGRWETGGKWVGRAGTFLAGASSAWGEWQADSKLPTDQRAGEALTKGASTAAGTWAGGEAGAWAGGAIGTAICPGVGTVIGAGLGGLIGGFAGSQAGAWVGDKIKGIGGAIGKGIGSGIKKIGSWF